jgi:hypothetical protein
MERDSWRLGDNNKYFFMDNFNSRIIYSYGCSEKDIGRRRVYFGGNGWNFTYFNGCDIFLMGFEKVLFDYRIRDFMYCALR